MATKNFTLNASADDAMEISGTVTLNGANGVVSAAARYAGFSFETAADPVAQGAVITSAIFTYRPASLATDDPDMTVKGHKVVNSAQYSTGSNNISARYSGNPTTASVSDIGSSVGVGARDVDVTGIVQELVNQGGWSGTSRIGLIFRGNSGSANGSMVFFDNGSNFATLTVVVADAGAGQPMAARGRLVPGMRRPHGSQGW